MNKSIEGNQQVVVITGASGGIGKALVAFYQKKDWFVVGIDQTRPEVANFNIEFNQKFFRQSHRVIEEIVDHGVSRIDALINNAALQILSPIEGVTPDQMQDSMSVNYFSPYFLVQSFVKLLREKKGSVVNISSIHTKLTKKEFSLYAASKSALSSMTKNLSLELAPDIRVNSISPAATATEMLKDGFKGNELGYQQLKKYHPMQRIADPIEVAQTAFFLTSDQAQFITGADIEINGGISNSLHDPSE
jgi:NAD(P)-dependent dehydrogenase (short-subunit alcohol dehydrogenase family)